MRFYWLVLGGLAVWRLTHLLVAEDGPWELVVRLRRALGNGFWGKLMDCFYCLSLWFAAPLAWWLGETWPERLLLWPALSAFASLLERVTAPGRAVPPALFTEDAVSRPERFPDAETRRATLSERADPILPANDKEDAESKP